MIYFLRVNKFFSELVVVDYKVIPWMPSLMTSAYLGEGGQEIEDTHKFYLEILYEN